MVTATTSNRTATEEAAVAPLPPTSQSLSKLGHIAKTHNGWKVTGDANGVLTWTSPNGATYTSHPHDYRPTEDDPPPF